MKFLEKNKAIVIAVVVFVLAIVAYNYFWSGTSDAASGTNAQSIGNDVVDLNQKLHAVTLDQSLFSSAEYRSLTDWSPVLSSGPSGRIDPFAPIGQ